MKRLLDINTWIALTLESHPHHQAARHWYGDVTLARGDLVFCRQTELGFLRLVTQEAVMRRCSAAPLSNAQAVEFLANVYDDAAVSRADEPAGNMTLTMDGFSRAYAKLQSSCAEAPLPGQLTVGIANNTARKTGPDS